jgi:CheY-like chemotaxis protein
MTRLSLLSQLILESEGYDLHLTFSRFPQVMNLDHVLPDLIILDYQGGRASQNMLLWQQLKADSSPSAISQILCTASARTFAMPRTVSLYTSETNHPYTY